MELIKYTKGNNPNSKKTQFKKGQLSWCKGQKLSKEHIQKIVENHADVSGQKHWNWRGGIVKHTSGYIRIYKPNHPFCDNQGYVFEHKLVMEKQIGRYLNNDEIVHHINKKKDDNRIENLRLFKNISEHMKFHRELERNK